MAGSIRMRHAIPAHTPNIQPVSFLIARLIVRLAELFLISVHLLSREVNLLVSTTDGTLRVLFPKQEPCQVISQQCMIWI